MWDSVCWSGPPIHVLFSCPSHTVAMETITTRRAAGGLTSRTSWRRTRRSCTLKCSWRTGAEGGRAARPTMPSRSVRGRCPPTAVPAVPHPCSFGGLCSWLQRGLARQAPSPDLDGLLSLLNLRSGLPSLLLAKSLGEGVWENPLAIPGSPSSVLRTQSERKEWRSFHPQPQTPGRMSVCRAAGSRRAGACL